MSERGNHEFFPTPRATDADRGGRGDLIQAVRGNPNSHYSMWPTPQDGAAKGRHGTRNLNDEVALTESISSSEGSLASPSVSRENVLHKMTLDGCGRTSPESFASYDPDTSWWKTCQGCLFEEWATFSETWQPSGMIVNGKAYRRQPLVPRTSGIGSGSWPTPVTYDATPGGPNNHYRGLGNMAKHNPEVLGTASSKGLATAAGGSLNPTWVEGLLGFPHGWTEVGNAVSLESPRESPNESTDSSVSGTASSPKSPTGSFSKSKP